MLKIKNNVDLKELKLYDEWNKERYNNREDKDNICPIGISNQLFIEIIKNVFLGSDWYTSMPLSTEQVNEEILEEILFKITRKTPKERCK